MKETFRMFLFIGILLWGIPSPYIAEGVDKLNKTDFYNKMLPYAEQVKQKTNIPVSVVLAQWGHESGFESSKWIGGNNYAGITKGRSKGKLIFRRYDSIQSFTDDYIRLLSTSSNYKNVIKTANTPNKGAYDVAMALSKSPWSGDHYNNGKFLTKQLPSTMIYDGLTKGSIDKLILKVDTGKSIFEDGDSITSPDSPHNKEIYDSVQATKTDIFGFIETSLVKVALFIVLIISVFIIFKVDVKGITKKVVTKGLVD